MEVKFKYVEEWLRSFYGDDVPPYEITDSTIDSLYELAHQNKLRDQQCDILIDEMSSRTVEYQSEASRLQQILYRLGIEDLELSSAGQQTIDALVSIADTLGINNVKDETYLLALDVMERERDDLVEKVKEKTTQNMELLNQSRDIVTQLHRLQNIKDELEQRQQRKTKSSETKRKEIEYIHAKKREYDRIFEQQLAELKIKGVSKSITHAELTARLKRINQTIAETKPLRNKLASYHGLPPDLALAGIAVEEAKQKLRRLEDTFLRQIDAMNM